jgi:hypothetical protein
MIIDRKLFRVWLMEQGDRLFDDGGNRTFKDKCPVSCYTRTTIRLTDVTGWADKFVHLVDRESSCGVRAISARRCVEILDGLGE